jgi:membrane fusion protein, multidrug efflux system
MLATRTWARQILVIAGSMLLFCSCSSDTAQQDATVSSGKSQKEKLPIVPVVAVQSLRLESKLDLPGQLLAYQDVPIHAKVEGYISWIGVDRGSIVKKGQKLITIFCPELDEKVKEGAAKLSAAESSYRRAQATEDSVKSKLIETQARLDADSLTFQRLGEAAKTPGAIAQNEVDIQQKTVESDRARVESVKQEVLAAENLVSAEQQNVQAARQVLNALNAMMSYLTIQAPFDGVITERNVHVGSIVAIDPARGILPLLRIQEKDILRLVVAVPESSVSGTTIGQTFEFTVPAFMSKKFYGIVARPAYALDEKTRTMPVELNVYNQDSTLDPGMFANVHWEVTRPYNTLFVPQSAVDSDLKGTFVIRIDKNTVERLKVERGLPMGSLIEVSGNLHSGDLVAVKATDELQTGTYVASKIADSIDLKNATKHSSAGGE